ncbi:MAG: hypothetical protein ACXVC6_07970 [Bacteroidia bacterium]
MEKKTKTPRKKNRLKGYPHYPQSEDIYRREKEESDLDPENPENKKSSNEKPSNLNEKDFSDDVSGKDLDIPSSEEEEEDHETLVNEDEENDYYSLGGDNHHELEENNGDV